MSGSGNAQNTDTDWQKYPYGGLVREITIMVLSIAIASVTLYMLVQIYWHAGPILTPDGIKAIERQKDILGLALGLFGTVTGYYFGRVPAEKVADAAKASEQKTKQVASANLDAIEAKALAAPQAQDINSHTDNLVAAIARARANLV